MTGRSPAAPRAGRCHTGGVHEADPEEDGWTVGTAAAAVGVTVRTLHHWDAVGLVRPSRRSPAGYRLYSPDDVARLRRVQVYRDVDVPLEQIPALLGAPAEEAARALLGLRDRVRERADRLRSVADALDRLAEARDGGLPLSEAEQAALFGAGWTPEHVAGARRRWGDSEQWAEHAERAAGRTREDWDRLAREADAVQADLAAACRAGLDPAGDEARALAERHRAMLAASFDCTHAMHVCLGRMFVDDAGFAEHFDALAPGLARWLRDAVEANARAHGVDPERATWPAGGPPGVSPPPRRGPSPRPTR